jgi:hypothetical protein
MNEKEVAEYQVKGGRQDRLGRHAQPGRAISFAAFLIIFLLAEIYRFVGPYAAVPVRPWFKPFVRSSSVLSVSAV